MKISLVIPVYNEQYHFNEVVAKYVADLEVFNKDWELIFVNDGCTDLTPKYMKELALKDNRYKVITFDKRTGKQAAITAAMEYASGDCVITADIDSMNPVGLLNKVILEWEKGNKIVYSYKQNSKGKVVVDSISERVIGYFTKVFKLQGKYIPLPNVGLYDRDVVDIMKTMPEKNKFLRTMDNWVDYEIFMVSYPTHSTKEDVKKDKKERAEKAKLDGSFVKRSKVRDHTKYLIYSNAFLVLFASLFIVSTMIAIDGVVNLLYILGLFLVTGLVGVISFMFFGKTLLIRKIGVIKKQTEEIYNITEVTNLEVHKAQEN